MIRKYIHVDKEAENSYSFAVGDEIRKALLLLEAPDSSYSYQKDFSHRKINSHFD